MRKLFTQQTYLDVKLRNFTHLHIPSANYIFCASFYSNLFTQKASFFNQTFFSFPCFFLLACVGLTLIFLPYFFLLYFLTQKYEQKKKFIYDENSQTIFIYICTQCYYLSFAMVMFWIFLYYYGIYILDKNRQNVAVGSESNLWKMF